MSNLPRPPAHLAPYVDALGVDMAVEFLLTFGGAEMYYSRRPTPRSQLVQKFGMDAARVLATAAQDHNLPNRVPTGKRWIAQVLHCQGASIASIARTLHTSDTTVRRYVRRTPANDPRQIPLI